MNNQRSSLQQFILIMALSFAAVSIFQSWFGPNKTPAGDAPAQEAKTLREAFAGIDPAAGPALNATTGAAELKSLTDRLTRNDSDEYSYWARLRAGLIQQYVLKRPEEAAKLYDEVINHNRADQVHAQAIYQKGDMVWKLAEAGVRGYSRHDGAAILEKLIHHGRGSSQYLDLEIMAPAAGAAGGTAGSTAAGAADGAASGTGATAAGATSANAPPAPANAGAAETTAAPAAGGALSIPAAFRMRAVKDLRGTLQSPDPQGVLDRVNENNKDKFFYKIFDGAVNLLGAHPASSYGLAIIFFALLTRVILQPLNKRQYESMKGMAIIAPEMKKIQQKYEKKKDQQSQMAMVTEIRELQRRHGVSPMLGCALALVQIPIFLLVVYPFIQQYEAKMELAGATFLWIQSLARADIPLLVLYAISQFVSIRLASTPPTDEQQRTMQLMTLFFPFVMPFFLLTWPSAFTLYWMTFNVLSTVFQYRMMKAADPEKTFIKSMTAMPGVIVAPDAPPQAVPARPKSGGGKSTSGAPKTITQNGPAQPGSPKNGAPGAKSETIVRAASSEIESGSGQPGASANGSAPASKKDARARRRRRF